MPIPSKNIGGIRSTKKKNPLAPRASGKSIVVARTGPTASKRHAGQRAHSQCQGLHKMHYMIGELFAAWCSSGSKLVTLLCGHTETCVIIHERLTNVYILSVLPRLLLQGGAPCPLFVTPCPFEKAEMTPCPFD